MTQKQMALELLKENADRYMPAWEFVGEKHIPGYGWVLMSYKTPARLSDLYKDGLVERKLVKGRSGSSYYAYKLICPEFLKDEFCACGNQKLEHQEVCSECL
jgi:hypothetical protein